MLTDDMLTNVLVTIAVMLVLTALFIGFHVLAERARALARSRGEACPEAGLRCLGCFAAGRCRARGHAPPDTASPAARQAGRAGHERRVQA